MTLINDNIENVKTALLVAIKNELTETYPVEFGDYKTSRGDVYTKVFWANSVRYQPAFPHCVLTPQNDTADGYEEIQYHKNEQGELIKRNITRSHLKVSIDVYDMGNEKLGRSNLKADSFAHKVARQLRKYFTGDGKLDWFSGNEYYPHQIGITLDDNIASTADWMDTDVKFLYSFDITLGWNDINDTIIDKAKGVEVRIDSDKPEIDKVIVKID